MSLLSAKSQRVAVVTGANKGVGFHIAEQIVKSGLFGTVILACRDAGRGQAAAKQVGGIYMPLEVGNTASTHAFAEAVKSFSAGSIVSSTMRRLRSKRQTRLHSRSRRSRLSTSTCVAPLRSPRRCYRY